MAHQNARPRRGVEGHRCAVAQRIDAFGRSVEAVLVAAIFGFRDAERQRQARFLPQLRSAHRSATSLGRVPISKKSTMHWGSPLKMKPRDPSATAYPLSPAKLARCAGSGLDMRNSTRE